MDISNTLAAKSNQLNTDDLISGPITIQISRVSAGSPEQPVAIGYEGDEGKPWYPCKSMRRVLVAAWGADASQYVGRRVTLFRDPEVMYGGIKVGGIRLSHLSDIDGPLSIALTVTRQKRAPYRVQPLATPTPPAPAPDPAAAALAVCQAAGLTDLGLAAFCDLVSSGSASTLAHLPSETLARIVELGISPETVAKCNQPPAAPAFEPAPAAPAENLPAAWS
jgi:hypothetical protein